jgi:DNA-binding protein YbaB
MDKTKLIKKINKIGELRKKAAYLESEFTKDFEKIYGYEFDFSKHDFLVDVIQQGNGKIKNIKDFEEQLNFSNSINN